MTQAPRDAERKRARPRASKGSSAADGVGGTGGAAEPKTGKPKASSQPKRGAGSKRGAGPKRATASGSAAGAKAAAATARRVGATHPPIPYTAEEIAEIFRRLAVQRPHPTSELAHVNTFTLLVAVVLSAQMTDMGVNRATRDLFARASDPAAMAALGEDAIREAIRQVSFFRVKARNVQRLSEMLRDSHGGVVPEDRASLEALPGVGRKTASVILNTAFGRDTLAVDTHILRLGNRLEIAPGKTPEQVEEAFLRIIPEGFLRNAHHWLILHGRFVCKARKPDCPSCVIADLCRAAERWSEVPAPLVTLPDAPPGPQPIPPGAKRPGGQPERSRG